MAKTVGALIVDEENKRFKLGKNWYDFADLLGYDVRVDNVRERQGAGIGVFGKARAAGSRSKLVTHSMDIVVKLDSLDEPIVTIPIFKKPLKGKAFDKAVLFKDETKAGLDYIVRHKA